MDSINKDFLQTEKNLSVLNNNKNLLEWYFDLYKKIFEDEVDFHNKKILEVGSGISPLKKFFPNIISSDILPLDHLDIIFDCHDIDKVSEIQDDSLDLIIATNVLHHLHDPLKFLSRAAKKLAKGGKIITCDPFFSLISYPIYKYMHHEPVIFNINQPMLEVSSGPLSSSNQAIPYLIFFGKREWLNALENLYDLENNEIHKFSGVSYFLTGGISKNFHIPHSIYAIIKHIDHKMVDYFPNIFASYFISKLIKK